MDTKWYLLQKKEKLVLSRASKCKCAGVEENMECVLIKLEPHLSLGNQQRDWKNPCSKHITSSPSGILPCKRFEHEWVLGSDSLGVTLVNALAECWILHLEFPCNVCLLCLCKQLIVLFRNRMTL